MWSRGITQQYLSSLLRASRRRSSSSNRTCAISIYLSCASKESLYNRHQLVLLHHDVACRRFTSDSSFHGIHLPDNDADDSDIQRNQPTIQEAEVVKTDEDKQKIRESIAEVVRAELSAYSAPNNNKTSQTDSDNSKEEENHVLEGYDRLMHMLNTAQTRHDRIILDQQKTNSLEYIQSTMDLGELHYQLGNMEQSQDMYMSALKQLLEKNNADNDNDEVNGNSIMMMMVAQCMHSLGAVHARCGEYDEAYRWYEEALKRKNDIVNSEGEASDSARCNNFELGKTYNAMAALQTMRGGMQWKEAMSMFQLAERHQLHGYISDDNNEYDDILERVTKQTVEQLTPHHVQSIVSIRFNVGKLLQQQSQYGDAVDAFRSALELARLDIERMRIDDAKELDTESVSNPSPFERKNIVVELLVHIADCLSSIHSYDEAAQAYEEALGYHIFFRKWEGRDRSNESEKQQESCLLPATISTTNIKLDIANATTMEAAIRSNLALALAHIGQEKLGLEHYEASLKIKRRIGGDDHIEVAHTLMGMGALYGGPMRDFATALNCFKEALYIYRHKLNDLTGADSLSGSNKFFGEDEAEEIDVYIQNAVKNIGLIEAGLLKDREEGITKTRRR